MDWPNLGMVALCASTYTGMYLITSKMESDKPSRLVISIPFTIFALMLEFLVGFAGYGMWLWGGLNSIMAIAIVGTLVGIPIFGKSLLVKTTTIIPHFVHKFIADFKQKRLESKESLEEHFPIKRSVYDLTND